MPIYDMKTGKRIEVEGAGPDTFTVMKYNKETGKVEYSVTPRKISENFYEKLAKWDEENEKKMEEEDGELGDSSEESSNSENSSESDSEESEDSDDTKINSEAKKIVDECTPEEMKRAIDNLRMKMENEQSASEPDSESDSEDSEDDSENDDDSEGSGDSESEDSEYTYDSKSGILTKNGNSEIGKTGKTENSSEGFNLEDVKKVFDAKAKEMKEKLKMVALTCVFSYLYVMSGPRIVSYFYPETNGKK